MRYSRQIKFKFNKILTGSLLFIWAACFFYACTSTTNPTETIPPTVNLYYPDSNGIIKNGDTIDFSGTISDNQQLHSMLLTIEGMQGQIYYTYNPVVDGMTSFNINTPWLVYGIPYDTTGYLNLLVTDKSENYTYKHWHMRLRY